MLVLVLVLVLMLVLAVRPGGCPCPCPKRMCLLLSLAGKAGAVHRVSILNHASADSSPVALVRGGGRDEPGVAASGVVTPAVFPRGYCVCPHSYISALESAGGPTLLLPLVHAACTPFELARALGLFRASLMRSTVNLKFAHTRGGFKALAFVLYRKQQRLLTSRLVPDDVLSEHRHHRRGPPLPRGHRSGAPPHVKPPPVAWRTSVRRRPW